MRVPTKRLASLDRAEGWSLDLGSEGVSTPEANILWSQAGTDVYQHFAAWARYTIKRINPDLGNPRENAVAESDS